LFEQEAQLDSCSIPGTEEIIVAHAVTYEERMKRLIYKLKYDSDRLIAKDLSLLLLNALDKLADQVDLKDAFIVPIPLSRWRKFKRGFNQAELLASHLARSSQLPILQGALKRCKHTRAQHDLNKQERLINLRNAFEFNDKKRLFGTLILLDDIHTSGSTLAEAARTLYLAGAQNVAAITVARALLHNT
jgi:ComF family protein